MLRGIDRGAKPSASIKSEKGFLMKRIRALARFGGIFTSLALFLVCTISPAQAASGAVNQPFEAGSARLSIAFGGATAFDQNYSVFGMGFGYFVADGVEAGLDAETWSGNSPRIEQVSPQLRLVINTEGTVKPYIGAFYRWTHIEAFRDLNTVGARAGVYVLAGRNTYFGAGLVQDIHLNCDRTVYGSCAEIFPELLVAVIF
jgi:hypothetical protein